MKSRPSTRTSSAEGITRHNLDAGFAQQGDLGVEQLVHQTGEAGVAAHEGN